MVENKDSFLPHIQYYDYLWPGDIRIHVIRSHGIDLILGYYSFIQTNAGFLSIGPLGSKLSEIFTAYGPSMGLLP